MSETAAVAKEKKRCLGKFDLLSFEAPAPEWVDLGGGRGVYVRALSIAEKDAFENASFKLVDDEPVAQGSVRARLVCLCACDEGGLPVFGEDDERAVGAKMHGAGERIYDAAARLNRLGVYRETPAKN